MRGLLFPLLQRSSRSATTRGPISESLRRAQIALFNKLGKDIRRPGNRRPLSPLDGIMKILWRAMYRRIFLKFQPRPHPNQYAYRSARGTERHLVSLLDGSHCALLHGSSIYAASFDIERAFDAVSNSHLFRALVGFQIGPSASRVFRCWVIKRAFALKGCTPQGAPYRPRMPFSAVLPH